MIKTIREVNKYFVLSRRLGLREFNFNLYERIRQAVVATRGYLRDKYVYETKSNLWLLLTD